MNSASRTAPRWLMTALLATAVCLGALGLSAFLEERGWMTPIVGVVGITAVAVATARTWVTSRALPTMIGVLTAIAVMLPTFVRDDSGARAWLPTPDALAALGDTVAAGVNYSASTVAPAPVTPELAAILAIGFVMVFLVAENLTVSWGLAGTAGFVIFAPWLAPIILSHDVPFLALLGALACWLAVLGLAHRTTMSTPPVGVAPVMTASVGAALAAILIMPLALVSPAWGGLPTLDGPVGSSTTTVTRLSLDLDLRTSLGERSSLPVMEYDTSGARPDAFKLHSLSSFDGAAWQRTPGTEQSTVSTTDILWPLELPAPEEASSVRVDVSLVGLSEDNIPLPTTPRAVDIPAMVNYVRDLDEVQLQGQESVGLEYSFEMYPSMVEPALLVDGNGSSTVVDESFLALPDAMDAALLTQYTQDVTAGAETRLAQAVAIQDHLRDTMEFTYSPDVSVQSDDAVGDFLESRTGYCVQFATTMIMMSRTLDIPARLAVGYLPGTLQDDGTYVVEATDAHAWPELWFPQAGWVRFEPTPAVQSGTAPRYSTVDSVDEAARAEAFQQLDEEVFPTADANPSPQETSETAAPVAQDGDTTKSGRWEQWAVVAAGSVAVLMTVWWLAVRRQRSRTGLEEITPDVIWTELHQALPEPFRWADAMTPREAAGHVVAVAARETPMSPQARGSLTSLMQCVEDFRYAAVPSEVEGTPSQTVMREWSAVVVQEARAINKGARATARKSR